MTVRINFDPELNITTFECHEQLTLEEFKTAVDQFNQRGATRHVLWDMEDASASQINIDDVRFIARYIKPRSDIRLGGKTAIVSPRDIEFGLSRMIEGYAGDLPLQIKIFRRKDLAWKWLVESDEDDS